MLVSGQPYEITRKIKPANCWSASEKPTRHSKKSSTQAGLPRSLRRRLAPLTTDTERNEAFQDANVQFKTKSKCRRSASGPTPYQLVQVFIDRDNVHGHQGTHRAPHPYALQCVPTSSRSTLYSISVEDHDHVNEEVVKDPDDANEDVQDANAQAQDDEQMQMLASGPNPDMPCESSQIAMTSMGVGVTSGPPSSRIALYVHPLGVDTVFRYSLKIVYT